MHAVSPRSPQCHPDPTFAPDRITDSIPVRKHLPDSGELASRAPREVGDGGIRPHR
jgi:hypothetical protein